MRSNEYPYKVVREGDYLVVQENYHYETDHVSIVQYNGNITLVSIDSIPLQVKLQPISGGRFLITEDVKKIGKAIVFSDELYAFKPRMEVFDSSRELTPAERIGNAVMSKEKIKKDMMNSTISSKVWEDTDYWIKTAIRFKTPYNLMLNIECLRESFEIMNFYIFRSFVKYKRNTHIQDVHIGLLRSKKISIDDITFNISENTIYKKSLQKSEIIEFIIKYYLTEKYENETYEQLVDIVNKDYSFYISELKVKYKQVFKC